MAFGASAGGVDTAALSKAKSIVAEAVLALKKDYGLVGILMGDVSNKVEAGYVQARNLEWREGTKFEIISAPTMETLGYVANQAAAIAARTPDALNNTFLKGEFEMSRVVGNFDLDNRDLELVRGGEPTAPAGDYERNVRNLGMEFVKNFFQTEICKSQTQARNTLGGLPYIVDSGNTYIADRTDAAHVNLRSYENAFGAAISASNVLTIINGVRAQGGKRPDLGVLPTALYTKFHTIVATGGRYELPNKQDFLGGQAFEFMGVPFIMEPGLDASFSGDCYLLTQEDWRFYMSKDAMSAQIMNNPAAVDASLFRLAFNAGVACVNPRRQGKGTGLT
ncbi:MAG: hypothetical protein ACK4NQ_00110 [Fimbriimonadaceae bacterium]